MDTSEQRKKEIFQSVGRRIEERDAARKDKVAAATESGNGLQSQVKSFLNDFDALESALRNGMSALKDCANNNENIGDSVSTALRTLEEENVGRMKALVADAAAYLPAYEMSTAQRRIEQVQADVERARQQLAPRPKFSFRSRRVKRADEKKEEKVVAVAADTEQYTLPAGADNCAHTFAAEPASAEHTRLETRNVSLRDATHCLFRVLSPLDAVRLRRLSHCCVVLALVRGSVFIEECSNCTFIIVAQQVRIHSSKECDFYVSVSGRAVVEHCERLRFAPQCVRIDSAPGVAEAAADLVKDGGDHWQLVEDFSWLREEQSPHWSLLPPEERIDDENELRWKRQN